MTDAFDPLKENSSYESLSVTCDVCGEEIATDDLLVEGGPPDVMLPALVLTATRIHRDRTGHDSVTVDAVRRVDVDEASVDLTVEL